ncbi:MAG: hypothetical protein SVR08_11875 [Spirochaetota bacterium]|nr:hypothetical protein [Spirochaetota bacterium]
MIERLKRLCKKSIQLFLAYGTGGSIAFLGFLYFAPPMSQMIQASHGLCGAIFVFIFTGGSIISGIVYWVLTGRGLDDFFC